MNETLAGAPPPKNTAAQDSRRLVPWRGLFALIVVGWILFLFTHSTVLPKIGIGQYRIEVAPGTFHEIWFLDTYAILASNDAVAVGENPYLPNRLDIMKRPHSYGPAWLYLRHFGLTRSSVFTIGAALVAAFVLVVNFSLQPHDIGTMLFYSGIACSTPVVAALERGNNDLVVFLVLAPLVPCLLNACPVWRWLAVPLLGVAAALKYYPAVAILVLLASGSAREIRWRVVATLVMLGLIGWHVLTEIPLSGTLPAPHGIFTFGAVEILRVLGMDGIGSQVAVITAGLIMLMVWWRSPLLEGWEPAPRELRKWLYFVLGAVILTGCFFVGQHFAYRWIFSIWLAPFLWTLSRESEVPEAVAKLARFTGTLLLALLWIESIAAFALHRLSRDTMMAGLEWVSFALQPVSWAFFACLVGFLVHFARGGFRTLIGQYRNTADRT